LCDSPVDKGEILAENPLLLIKIAKPQAPEIVYLTWEELKKLVNTDCRYDEVKRAFIFSCLTGLRWSDVSKLQWSEIQQSQGKYSIAYRQQKTSELNYLPLSDDAVCYLGEIGSGDKNVFSLKSRCNNYYKYLLLWAKNAGVEKKINYHSSRHTFAVLQLSFGTSIFTLQKLMGHKDIRSTMVYADIVDSEKERAMNIIPSIL
jgi:integrase